MGYQKEAIKGFSWMTALRGSTRLLSFLRTAVLARLLTPLQFGLFGIASLVLSLLEILTETGINIFLIQEDENVDRYLDTAWMVSIIRGIIISALLFAFARPISKFFNSPDSYSLILLIALTPFLRGFINPAMVKFKKDLEFGKEFITRFMIFLVDASVAISFALYFRTPSSLVCGILAGVIVEVFISHVFITPRPRLGFNQAVFKKVIGRGKWFTVNGIFNFLFQQGDDAVVGKVMDASNLGVYQNAYKISTFPITEVGQIFHQVSFPVFVKIEGDRKRLLKAFMKVVGVVSVLVIPFGIVLFLFPQKVILLVLGPNWLEGTKALKILAVYGVLRAITYLSNPIFLATKKQNYTTAVTFVALLGMGISIVPLVKSYGILGAAWSALVGWILAVPVIVFFLVKIFREK